MRLGAVVFTRAPDSDSDSDSDLVYVASSPCRSVNREAKAELLAERRA
jgi:hypothetical protein